MAAISHVLVMIMVVEAVKVGGYTIDTAAVCLGCICRALSGCDIQKGCYGPSCGLFDIRKEHWMDAGRPVQYRDDPRDKQAFERCVLEPFCAAKTVLAYTNKYAKDCDGDGKVTCMDLFLLHTQGPKCSPHSLSITHKQNILSCLKENESNGKSGLEENKPGLLTSTPTPTTLKSTYVSTTSTKPSTKVALTTQIFGYPTKQTTVRAYRTPKPVSTNKPSYKPQNFHYPTQMTPIQRHTTPRRPMNGTLRALTNVRTFTGNNTFDEKSILESQSDKVHT